jgi:hypothetical protein
MDQSEDNIMALEGVCMVMTYLFWFYGAAHSEAVS